MAAVAITLLAIGGVVMAAAVMLVICLAVYEEFHALWKAGHRPVCWPTWVGLALSVPLMALGGAEMLVPIAVSVCLVTVGCIMFRPEPKLEDCLMSVLPLLSVVLPGMCAMRLALIPDHTVQIISGAVGGLIGSLVASLLVGLLVSLFAGASYPGLPAWWHYVLLGVIGGAVGQIGDLFASLVKRHCGIKDFANLFPGHGGMLDRMDSILFMALVMMCYRLLVG